MIGPKLTHNAPASGLIKYWFARCWYWLAGWDVAGELPKDGKFVLIAAHHTSNWDFPLGLCATFIFRLKTSWMGKDTLFIGASGVIMRALGGIAVDRDSPQGVVKQTAAQLKDNEKLVIALAADGSRSIQEYWKSGFYWIAHEAQVPVVCGYLDYSRKLACVRLSFLPTGNVKQDMDKIRDFYSGIRGKKPELETPVRLRDE